MMAATALVGSFLGWVLHSGSGLWDVGFRDQGFSLTLISHRLPFWFLVFSLFLPRVSLAVAWFQGVLLPFHLVGWIPLVFAIVLPRVLVLYLIYVDQGVSLWFLIHLVVAVLVWGGSGHTFNRRRGDY